MRKKQQRERFDTQTREKILKKTKGRCAICGTKLDLTNMTVDHFIPLNEYGTNDIPNLIPLCADDNKKKSTKIIKPEHLGYLTGQEKKHLRQYIKVIDEREQVKTRGLFFSHIIDVEVHLLVEMKAQITYVPKTVSVKTAYYNDLDNIYNFLVVYHARFRTGWGIDQIKNHINIVFEHGAFYYVEDINGLRCVIGIIPEIGQLSNDKDYYFLRSELYIHPDISIRYSDSYVKDLSLRAGIYYGSLYHYFIRRFVEQWKQPVVFMVRKVWVSADTRMKELSRYFPQEETDEENIMKSESGLTGDDTVYGNAAARKIKDKDQWMMAIEYASEQIKNTMVIHALDENASRLTIEQYNTIMTQYET